MSAGVQSVLSFAKETTYGTDVTPTKSLQIRPTGSIDIKNNIAYIPGIRGQLAKNYSSIKGKTEYAGDITFDAYADYLGYFLLSALGTDTPALHAGESVVYDHVFTESATKPSMTIEAAIAENTRRIAGAIAHTLKFSSKPGEMLEVQASLLGKSQATSTAITPSFSTVPALNHTQLAFKIGGSTLTEVEDFELTFTNNLEMIYTLGSSDPTNNAVGTHEVSGKLTFFLDSTTITQMTNYINNTSQSIEVIATGGSIGTAANYVLDILVPKATFKTATTKISDKHNMLEMEFEGFYDTSTSKLLSVTLTNLLTSY